LDETTKKLEPRISQVCDENNCEKYYSCTNGDCQDTTDLDDNSNNPSTGNFDSNLYTIIIIIK